MLVEELKPDKPGYPADFPLLESSTYGTQTIFADDSVERV